MKEAEPRFEILHVHSELTFFSRLVADARGSGMWSWGVDGTPSDCFDLLEGLLVLTDAANIMYAHV